ncbi:hypothetical protein EYR27_03055 [Xanthomonas oryzae]|nr:hypothetical protein EYR27_03055 [Xanthomonas oryzae]
MICSSEKRFFTSNLLGIGNWTPNQGATQTRGEVAYKMHGTQTAGKRTSKISGPHTSSRGLWPLTDPPQAGLSSAVRQVQCSGSGLTRIANNSPPPSST